MKCKKCGRPMGKNNLCAHCDKQKLDALKNKKQKHNLPIILSISTVLVVALALVAWLTLGGDAAPEKHHVEIEIQDYGTIAVELDAQAAPITVENFLKLAESGFYDGLTFHRIIAGFMMQGGDPEGTGMGGSSTTIKGEFSSNGVENPLSHTRGAISMARSSAYDSASSQFFICHADSTFLDGDYACFGYVTDGMDVVDAVCAAAQPTDGNGTIAASEQPVITHIRVID